MVAIDLASLDQEKVAGSEVLPSGKVDAIGEVFSSPVVRVAPVSTPAFAVIGSTDGYHLADSTDLVFFYDVTIGSATEIVFRLEWANNNPLLPNIDERLIPVGANAWVHGKSLVLDTGLNVHKTVAQDFRITTTDRGVFVVQRKSPLVRIQAKAIAANASTQWAVAVAALRLIGDR